MSKIEKELPVEAFRRRFRVRNPLIVNLLTEIFGTALLVFVGIGTVAQFELGKGKINNFMQVAFGWGMAVALCVYCGCKTSGGHYNPAVSLAMVSLGNLSFVHFIYYSIIQTIGAFFGSALSYMIYYDEINFYGNGTRHIRGPTATASVFCSFPLSHISHWTCFIDQIAGTGVLLLFVNAIIDKRNRIPAELHPFFFGLTIFAVISSTGMNVGAPLNPARDLGPRLFLWLGGGYGWDVMSFRSYYLWIPIVAPLIGALLGTWLYQFFIGIHIPESMEHNLEQTNAPLSNKNTILLQNDHNEEFQLLNVNSS